jgi:hypothetical protein
LEYSSAAWVGQQMRLEEQRARIVLALYRRVGVDFFSPHNDPSWREMLARYYQSSPIPRPIKPVLLYGEERENALAINDLFLLLHKCCDDFEGALALMDHSRGYQTYYARWGVMALNTAMLSTWTFGEALREIDKLFRKCPTLTKILGRRAVWPAMGDFGAAFGDVEGMRNSASHVAKRLRPNFRRKDAIKNLRISSSVVGNRLIHSRDGKLLTFEVSQKTLDKLIEIKSKISTVFVFVNEEIHNLRFGADAKGVEQQASV